MKQTGQTTLVRSTLWPPSPPTVGTYYDVPAGIDNTGATDVTSALQTWIDGVPDGTSGAPSILRFNGGVYKINTGLTFIDRNNLTIESSSPTLGGNTELRWGVTMTFVDPDWTAPDGQQRFMLVEDSTNITFRYLYLHGPSPMPGSGDGHVPWQTYVQWMHGIEMRRTTGYLVDYVRIDDMPGDGVAATTNGNFAPRSTGTIRNSDIHECHRNAISLIGSDYCLISANSLSMIGFWVIDLEPNEVASSNYDTTISGNTFGTQGNITSRVAIGAFSGIISGGSAYCEDLFIDSNTFSGRTFSMSFNNVNGYPYDQRIQRLTVTNNVGDASNPWYPVECRQIDDITCSNNSFTMISGTEFELWLCTGINITDSYTIMA